MLRVCVIALAFLATFPALAALTVGTDLDFPAATDGFNVTEDTVTGLQWLDVTITAGRTFGDMVGTDGSNEFAPGGDFEGWRHATFLELTGWTGGPQADSLYKNFGFNSTFNSGGGYGAVRPFLAIMGCLGQCGSYGYNYGIHVLDADPMNPEWAEVEAYQHQGTFFDQGSLMLFNSDIMTPEVTNMLPGPIAGHYLVRNAIFLSPFLTVPWEDSSIAPIVNPFVVAIDSSTIMEIQNGLSSGVFGGSREITLTANTIGAPTPTSLEHLGPGTPNTFRFVAGTDGGSVAFGYPLAAATDVTFGGSEAVPMRIRVGATQMQAGADLTLSLLDDLGSSASYVQPTTAYSDVTPTYYDYYLDPDTFSGSPSPLDFTAVEEVGLTLSTLGNDTDDLTGIRFEAVAEQPVSWDKSFVLQPTGGGFENPLIRVGFNPQPEPPAYTPVLDLSVPSEIKITLQGQSTMDFRLFLATLFPPDPIMPMTIDPSGQLQGSQYAFTLENGQQYTVEVEFASSVGYPPDPIKWRGFNPQPEPPALSTDTFGFDFSFGELPGGFAASALIPDEVSVTIRIRAPDDSLLTFSEEAAGVPALPAPAIAVLAFLLVGAGIAMLRRSELS